MKHYLTWLICVCALGGAVAEQDTARERNREAGRVALVKAIAVLREQARDPNTVNASDTSAADADTADAGEQEPGGAGGPSPPTASSMVRQAPLYTGGIRAPRLSRPPADPLSAITRRTMRDAITRPVEFGEPALGFTPPDWTEPLRDLEADVMVTDLNTGETILTDNVRLRLGEMLFSSDEFRYAEDTGHYQASGNVSVRQHYSQLAAGKIVYVAPELAEIERSLILEPGPDEQQLARRRLSMGRLLAEQLHVIEPTRELYADYVDYDFATQTGELCHARGLAAFFFFDADHVHILGPDDAIIRNAWLTTCENDPPHYRINVQELTIRGGEAVLAKRARLQIGRHKTPLYIPFWRGGAEHPWTLDFESGRRAEIGYFTNLGLQFELSPELSAGPRIMPTHKEGIGLGADIYYDFMNKPSSRLYRTQGEAHVLYTTKERGHGLWRHRYEYDNDLVLRMEVEQWSDRDFYKDFFYDQYRHRTTPRTFANVTYRRPDYIATGTIRLNTHSWIPETERIPEASFHLIERPLAQDLYVSYDNITGYNRRKSRDPEGFRTINIARASYAIAPHPALGLTPFYEVEGAWYQRLTTRDESASRFSNLLGVTATTRFHKMYPGFLGFSGFKHVVQPSVTYSYRPSATMSAEEAPRYDALDNIYGRSRIESKLSNVVYGRDAETGDVWQVGRLTLYQGNDFWNEVRKTDDYQVELDIRPRPWWGAQLVGERHKTTYKHSPYQADFYERLFYRVYENLFNRPFNERAEELRTLYADYDRVLTQLYYDDTILGGKLSGRIGFAYSSTYGRIYNREVLYGLGYRLSENWGVSFEHIYDLYGSELRSQTYEVRRRFHCWESALRFRDRQSGFDINLELSLVAFPGSTIKF